MKRFWKQAVVVEQADGFAVALDGKPMRTPAKRLLIVPKRPLAEAIAGEWDALGPEFDPQVLILTRFANTAIDRVQDLRDEVVEELTGWGGSDLVCYRVEVPLELARRQAACWDPVIEWARGRFDIHLKVTTGLMPVRQPDEVAERLRAALAWRPDADLAALHTMVSMLGSLLLGLAVAEGFLSLEDAWTASRVDEDHQAAQWGADSEAEARTAKMKAELEAAHRFLILAAA
ncbi:ATPase [Oleomonas cavernae]|uniref:ATPase n=1 Tax=Oleomonas cavernae TaxID=2320859 RepID=A0A418WEC1_9PROT|nr:ATP12 family protein [Oleomonas cavernae]RJF88368.1 ATPase [Oleomonas cavernae]